MVEKNIVQRKRLRETLKDKSKFAVIVELTGGPNYSFFTIENFLKDYKTFGSSSIPEEFDFVGITSPHNPGGTPNIETANVLSHLKAQGLLDNLDFIPHISCKDENADAIVSSLAGFAAMDVEPVLVITGDKPVKGKGLFELESIGLLKMISEMDAQAYLKASPEEALGNLHQFFAGAVVSPFKYTEASQMQQYYKMEKKIISGANFIITQVGWDWKKSMELFRYLKKNNLDVPVLGNVFLLSTMTQAPRLMHDLRLPGCFVSDELFAKVSSETISEHLERAAQQVAMYKSIGAAGVDIGSIHIFRMLAHILKRASEIGDNWEQYKDNLYWPKKGGFYLYNDAGEQTALSKPKKKFRQKSFNFMHRNFLSEDCRAFAIIRKVMSVLGAQKNKGVAYEIFSILEYAVKRTLFDCEMCGDCYLPEDFGLCTMGGCEKGLANAPCGDAIVDGYCGNNFELRCIGERIYNAAAAELDGIKHLQSVINAPRIHCLEQTSSILNHLFGKDHSVKPQVRIIGNLIDMSNPRVGKIAKMLHSLGTEAYSKPSGLLNWVKALIELQAFASPYFISINVDSKGPVGSAVEMVVEYVRMVRKWGKTIPVCIYSRDPEVIFAGLKQWYSGNKPFHAPLIGPVDFEKMKEILEAKKTYDFNIIGMLGPNETSGQETADDIIKSLHLRATQIVNEAVKQFGFKNSEIFLELNAPPLAQDLPKNEGRPGQTFIAFETMRRIKHDPQLRGVRCLMRPDKISQTLPRKIGIVRAYIAKAIEYGLDAVFADPAHRFGVVKPDAELVNLIDAYAKMDGSAEHSEKVTLLMNTLCRLPQKFI